jgi:sterol desaturase/sphingolipid hydroxylase (fatty acid hydroxylase superfamily)
MTVSTLEIVCTALLIGSAVFFMLVERRFSYNKGQRAFREGFWLDMFWYNIIQSFVLGLIISRFIAWIDTSSGFSRLQIITDWPIWAQVALFLVTHDLYIYCFHRLQHNVPKLWRLHEAHHSVPNVDWLSGVRSHPLEILINQTIEFLPIVLLGAAPEVAAIKGVISAVWGMYIHSNLDMRTGWIQKVINGPEMHRWHHAIDPRAMNRNFATKFAIWDWLFGTAFLPKGEKAQTYGLDYDYPKGYFSQTMFAFRKEPSPAIHDSHSDSTSKPLSA